MLAQGLTREASDELWGMLRAAGAKPAKERAVLAKIGAVINSYAKEKAYFAASIPASRQRDHAGNIHEAVVHLCATVREADTATRRRFYRRLAKTKSSRPVTSKVGKDLFGTIERSLVAAAEATLARTESKVKSGRRARNLARDNAVVALGRIWEAATGQPYRATKKNPYSGNVSRKGLSARFVARALELGLNEKIGGSIEHIFERGRQRLKSPPPSGASSESYDDSGSGSSS